MALNAYQLEDLIVFKLNDAGFQTDGNDDQLAELAGAIAEAVVEHITARAEVHVNEQVCPVR